MAKVIAKKRVTVDREMKYSGRQETWDFLEDETTEVPDAVADELLPEFPELDIAPDSDEDDSKGSGVYKNRMMTSGTELCGEPTITGGPCKNKKPCWRHKKINLPGRG